MLIMTIQNNYVPLNQRCSTILKTVEVPTHRPLCIFVLCFREHVMVHVCSHDHTEWSHGCHSLNRKCPTIAKTVEISIHKSSSSVTSLARYIKLFVMATILENEMHILRAKS
jgi:hypothetical protein